MRLDFVPHLPRRITVYVDDVPMAIAPVMDFLNIFLLFSNKTIQNDVELNGFRCDR